VACYRLFSINFLRYSIRPQVESSYLVVPEKTCTALTAGFSLRVAIHNMVQAAVMMSVRRFSEAEITGLRRNNGHKNSDSAISQQQQQQQQL